MDQRNNMILSFLKLIRWPNLIIIVLTQYCIRYLVIGTAFSMILPGKAELVLPFFFFNLLVLSTVCIAAAGYIINDYFDIRIDRINKPDKMVIGKKIDRRIAIVFHWFFTIVGLLLALMVCYVQGLLPIFVFFLFVSGALWFYSTTYKHMPLVGNLIIAVLAALVPLTTGAVDVILINRSFKTILASENININLIAFWVLAFSGFAFLYTLIREIIKDLSDMKGDMAFGSKTIPIVWGIKWAKGLVAVLYAFSIFLMIFLHYRFLKDLISLMYIIIFIILPSLFSLWKVLKGKERKEYEFASNVNKLASVFGVLFSVVFYFYMKYYLS